MTNRVVLYLFVLAASILVPPSDAYGQEGRARARPVELTVEDLTAKLREVHVAIEESRASMLEAIQLARNHAARQERLIARQARLLEQLENARGVEPTDPPVDPPTRGDPPVDPPPVDPPPTVPPPLSWGAAPERIEPYRPAAVHAEVYPDGTFTFDGQRFQGGAVEAYSAVDATLGTGPVVLGIHGRAGPVDVGHAYSKWSDTYLKDKDAVGVEVYFVGRTPDAEIGPTFLGSREQDAGVFSPAAQVGFVDIGIRGSSGSFAVLQYGDVGELTFDGFWVLPDPGMASDGATYASAFHMGEDWEVLTFKGYQPRGLKLREHCFYLKPGGITQVLDCELFGGRRTGFQARPHSLPKPSPKPHGFFIADGNFAEDFGWNWTAAEGGQWISVWCSLEYPVRISNNRLTGARYGALGILKGVMSSGPYLTDDGWSHSNVFVYGNSFETGNDRAAVVVNDTRVLHWGPGNEVITTHPIPLTFGNEFGAVHANARRPGLVRFYGADSVPTFPVFEFDLGTGSYAPVEAEVLESMLVPLEQPR